MGARGGEEHGRAPLSSRYGRATAIMNIRELWLPPKDEEGR